MSDTRVVAHFFVQSVTITGKESIPTGQYSSEPGPRDVGSVKLGAVVRGELNKNWSAYTPWGSIELGTVNPDAFASFVEHIGQEYEVVLRPLHTQNGEPLP